MGKSAVPLALRKWNLPLRTLRFTNTSSSNKTLVPLIMLQIAQLKQVEAVMVNNPPLRQYLLTKLKRAQRLTQVTQRRRPRNQKTAHSLPSQSRHRRRTQDRVVLLAPRQPSDKRRLQQLLPKLPPQPVHNSSSNNNSSNSMRHLDNSLIHKWHQTQAKWVLTHSSLVQRSLNSNKSLQRKRSSIV